MRLPRKLRSIIHRLAPPKPQPLILMYHRIADEPIDPWALAVSPIHFEEQLDVLRRTRHPFSLTDFVRHMLAGTLPRSAVAVTFDDGYVDNLFAGKARLAAADVPATVFVVTGYLGRPGEFWWDELARLLLSGEGPPRLEIVVRGNTMRFELEEGPPRHSTGSWRALMDPPRTRRQAAYVAIWQALRPLNEEERNLAMPGLRTAFLDRQAGVGPGRAMTYEEVRVLAADGLVEVGAHTVSHPPLAELDAVARFNEITKSKAACEALTGAPVHAFSYPYGSLDSEVRAAVGAAGFSCACSVEYRSVGPGSDILALPRIQVRDWHGDRFQRALFGAAAGY